MKAVKHYNAFTSRPLTTLHELEDGGHYNEPLLDEELILSEFYVLPILTNFKLTVLW